MGRQRNLRRTRAMLQRAIDFENLTVEQAKEWYRRARGRKPRPVYSSDPDYTYDTVPKVKPL
jgi:hypothetical protein